MSASTETTFEVGLVLAGAVSAGAYTAGVMDYLIEALESWHQAKEKGAAVPMHNVKIKVITGASAGGMTAAISVVELLRRAAKKGPPPAGYKSLMYQAWVKEIDIEKLLCTSDLEKNPQVKSLLDSTVIDSIADEIIRPEDPPAWQPIPFVDEKLKLYLTLSNLRGLPYSIRLNGETNLPYGMTDHADYQYVEISAGTTAKEWRMLRNAAVATGAFPVGLASRLIKRDTSEYKERILCDGRAVTKNLQLDVANDEAYHFVAVDGGMLNNEPIELARSVWNKEKSSTVQDAVESRWLDESPKTIVKMEEGRKAIIIADPFPDQPEIGENPTEEDTGLLNILGKVIGAMRSQSLFKIEELILASTENVYSRFLIAPVRKTQTGHNAERAIASGFFHGFGGFLAEEFREHDYHLGRRNCQQFLKKHFALPEQMVRANPVFEGTISEDYFFEEREKDDDGTEKIVKYYPVIPVVRGSVVEPEQGKNNTWPVYDRNRAHVLEEGIRRRVKAILRTTLPFGWVRSGGAAFTILLLAALVIAGEFIKISIIRCDCLVWMEGLRSTYILIFQVALLVAALLLVAMRTGMMLLERKLVKKAYQIMLSAMKNWGIAVKE